ncbi:MAG: hypothetical protein GF401_09850 [Chitinivibrionales bacterium]|nr:hypothetical protein [Chitinivibrionales bacterium]
MQKALLVKKIQCVTYPRSGHHLLADLLICYYAKDPRTSLSSHDHFIAVNRFQYCEYFNHCKTVPCTDHETTYQKNHDMHLDQPVNPDYNYIIQYRNPLESLVSFFTVSSVEHSWIKDEGVESWQKFSEENIVYWKQFAEKWLSRKQPLKALYVNYGDLLANPSQKLQEVIDYLEPGAPIDTVLIDAIVDSKRIHKRNHIADFKYFDSSFFSCLAKKVAGELDAIGLTAEVNQSILR